MSNNELIRVVDAADAVVKQARTVDAYCEENGIHAAAKAGGIKFLRLSQTRVFGRLEGLIITVRPQRIRRSEIDRNTAVEIKECAQALIKGVMSDKFGPSFTAAVSHYESLGRDYKGPTVKVELAFLEQALKAEAKAKAAAEVAVAEDPAIRMLRELYGLRADGKDPYDGLFGDLRRPGQRATGQRHTPR